MGYNLVFFWLGESVQNIIFGKKHLKKRIRLIQFFIAYVICTETHLLLLRRVENIKKQLGICSQLRCLMIGLGELNCSTARLSKTHKA
jgi:hypothetical protein